MSIPFNQFLIVVGYNRTLAKYSDRSKYPMGDPDRNVLYGRVSADMGMDPPEPELTYEEMQYVARAAKMALAKVIATRKRRGKRPKQLVHREVL
jgi:hypothetical protein